MSMLAGVVRYEYAMGLRRPGLWLAMVLASVPTLLPRVLSGPPGGASNPWPVAGLQAVAANVFLPLIAGIVIADRLPRDWQLGVAELLRSTPLTRRVQIAGKYLAAVLAVLTPTALLIAAATLVVTLRAGSASIVAPTALAFVAVNVPAFLFVAAFSLACPAVMPVRVYQVLFTGYWFWGNFLNPKAFPTINGTVLTASGVSAAHAFFGTPMGSASSWLPGAWFAVANLATLAACAVAVLMVLEKYLTHRDNA